MPVAALALLDEPEHLRTALTPLRRRLLERLASPASATELGAELGLGRQRVNYHLRALESAGLLELVEERRRRGCTERVLRAAAGAFVVDPGVLAASEPAAADRFAAEHLVGVAAGTIRDVARMQAEAHRRDERLLTFTVEAEASFGSPAELEAFTDALAEAIRATAAAFHRPGGRRYRVVAAGHPSPQEPGPGR